MLSDPTLFCYVTLEKPACAGIAVVLTPCVSWACQSDNVPIHQLCFSVNDLTIAIPLPTAPIWRWRAVLVEELQAMLAVTAVLTPQE